MDAYKTYTIEREGLSFRVEYHYDEDLREPWKEHDGHGIISDWTNRDKQPSERVLIADRSIKRFYDIGASIKLALSDGWDCQARRDEAEKQPERKRTKREIAARAVEADFENMRAWCNDEWKWAGVVVTLLDVDGEETNERESLWGIESTNETEYLKATALELADEILTRVPANGKLVVLVRK